MTLDDSEHQNKCFYGFFGNFLLRIQTKSLEIDWDSLCMKLSALNVVLTSLNFAPCIQGILRTLNTLSKYSHLATRMAAATRDDGTIWRM